ncbi:MAG: hypothetical protein SFX74_03385 [Fimbriimonadaceae bacterium]|nr:hypothetical protein [Fimbriimonadaceae bacterium]
MARGVSIGIAFSGLLSVANLAAAQSPSPDVRVKVDALASVQFSEGGSGRLRLFDLYGRPGTVGLTAQFESGLKAYLSQRLQRPVSGTDREFVDEVYLEDEGLWRVGKQVLPFGYRSTFFESALAVRGETNLILEGIPFVVAVCDAGPGRMRGVVGRVGSQSLSVSIAGGQHFGASASSFGLIRLPEAAPGRGRGYGLVAGGELIRRIGTYGLKIEVVSAQQGATVDDRNFTLWDVSMSGRGRNWRWEIGATRTNPVRNEILRLGASFRVDDRTSIEPVIRFRDGRISDGALQVRFRF